MPTQHRFGGNWTDEKLERVRKYLTAYTKIFHTNAKAKKLNFSYVDAFAGTGYRNNPRHRTEKFPLLPELTEPETEAFLKGSARIALEVTPPFKQYIFIDQEPEHIQELHQLKAEFATLSNSISIVQGDATEFLLQWCHMTDWRFNRAVVFLDPYGMQVEWSVIKAIADTQSIDLWLLFPLGMAVNRMLTKAEPPPEDWTRILTRFFGTSDWQSEFYSQRTVMTLFGEEDHQIKDADFDRIGRYFVDRLKTVFTSVADNPLPLYNSRNIPLFLLCFAAGNPKGASTAVKIAQHILRR